MDDHRHRFKRNRAQTETEERTSAASEEVEEPEDEFEEACPKSKRKHAAADASFADVLNLDQSLIDAIRGNGKQIPHVECGAKYDFKKELLDETNFEEVCPKSKRNHAAAMPVSSLFSISIQA